jgi:DNA-nicking Smr family endonuclease
MSSTRGRRRRTLSEEERDLWKKVADSIEPLERRRVLVAPQFEDPEPAPPLAPPPAPISAPEPIPPRVTRIVRPEGPSLTKRALAGWTRMIHVKHGASLDGLSPAVPAPPSLARLDDRTKRRLVRGTVPIDERLDLHGLTQEAAHSALRHFLVSARARGARIVLVITGKGRGGMAAEVHERGVLRRSVPHWLADPSLRSIVLGFEEAHLAHGGAGAIYVRLRRFDREDHS